MKPLKAISLFTGAGGLDLGFEAAGYETVVAVEMDPNCTATLRLNRPWSVISRDVATISTNELLHVAKLKPGEADILIGGPPCQPFSKSGFWASGDAQRLSDPRATTIDHYLRILAETRPRAFLMENVEGLGFRGKDEGLERIRAVLKKINSVQGCCYSASVALLNAADFGVPQLRRRLFIVGSRDGSPFVFPNPTHADPYNIPPASKVTAWMTAWDALHDLPMPQDLSLALKGKWAELLPSIPEGLNYLHHTDRGEGEPLFGWRRRYWSFLLKLAKDRPAWTIQAQPGPATGPFHWSSRRLSMREMARLQTFPDDVWISGNLSEIQRQLGNAVPSLLAEILARSIRHRLLGASRLRSRPKLTIYRAPLSPPAPEIVAAVPPNFLCLRGRHLAHPGKGQGYRAISRTQGVYLSAAE